MQQRERELEEKEKGSIKQPDEMLSIVELQLWKRQAQAISRSPKHVQKIELLLTSAVTAALDFLQVSRRDLLVRRRDQDEFIQQALELMEKRRQ